MLSSLQLCNIGPADASLQFGRRLTVVTGDNGVGKSFLLDVAWWAMTRSWPAEVNPRLTAGKVALPRQRGEPAEIRFSYEGTTREATQTATFDAKRQGWGLPVGRSAHPGLVLYGMSDGSFAVWDPVRNARTVGAARSAETERPAAYVFSPSDVWNGLQRDDGVWLCNGLIRDWASWQREGGAAFERLKAALAVLSPSSMEKMRPGALRRISLDDVRDVPSLVMPYGQDVPIVHASSGMRRIVALAYFLVWCWQEHLAAAELVGEPPERRMTFLVDEIEAHLHPKWQRRVVPALLQVMEAVAEAANVQLQLIAVTHAPLVMASLETLFDPEKDRWWDLDLSLPTEGRAEVIFTERPFQRHGDVSAWLTSEAFDLKSPRSAEVEAILENAATFLAAGGVDAEQAQALDRQLRSVLGERDPFWLRWRFVGEKKGWLS